MAADRGGWARRKREVADGTGAVRAPSTLALGSGLERRFQYPEILVLQLV